MTCTGGGETTELFLFDRQRLAELAEANAARYQTAEPFPHVVIDGFLPDDVLRRVIAAFPGPDELAWTRFRAEQEVKLASDEPAELPPYIQHVLAQFNSAAMVTFLERLTGIQGLVPDPHLWGGGLHQIQPGGWLKVHADFNRYERLRLDRRLNLIVYLNEDWDPDWGGALELWDRDMTDCRQKIAPLANRCVVFSTTSDSYHGHPDPLACPPGRTRRSLALYYYTNGRPVAERRGKHSTLFRARPGEEWDESAGGARVRRLVNDWVPPGVVELAGQAKRRVVRS